MLPIVLQYDLPILRTKIINNTIYYAFFYVSFHLIFHLESFQNINKAEKR